MTYGLDWTAAPAAGLPHAAARDCRDRDAGALRSLVSRYRAWRARRQTVRILNAVDSATLRDLGIVDVESEVYGDPEDRMRGYDPCWWKR